MWNCHSCSHARTAHGLQMHCAIQLRTQARNSARARTAHYLRSPLCNFCKYKCVNHNLPFGKRGAQRNCVRIANKGRGAYLVSLRKSRIPNILIRDDGSGGMCGNAGEFRTRKGDSCHAMELQVCEYTCQYCRSGAYLVPCAGLTTNFAHATQRELLERVFFNHFKNRNTNGLGGRSCVDANLAQTGENWRKAIKY